MIQIWSKGLLGIPSPQSLVDMMVFMVGLYFALRSGQENRQLHFSSVTFVEKAGITPYFLYVESASRITLVASNIENLMLSKLFTMQTVKIQGAVS